MTLESCAVIHRVNAEIHALNGTALPDKTNIETELAIMAVLERGETISQKTLSQRLSVSVGLVNAFLKRVTKRGYVKAKAVPYRRWAYYLTPKGFTEKSRLVATYLEGSLTFFRKARQEYAEIFAQLRAAGRQRVMLVGGGELAEIALLSAREAEIEVVGLFDRETNADGFQGLPVLRDIEPLEDVVLVITASRKPQEIYGAMLSHGKTVVAPSFLHILRSTHDGAPARQESEA